MDVERWQRLSSLLDVLLELNPPAQAARLEALRRQDPELAADLGRLLALEEVDDARVDRPLHDAAELPPVGKRIGPYRMDAVLGEGGMGMVWLASRANGLYQRQVALKLLRPGFADPNLRLRFSREREILARLAHPNIAGLLDAGIGSEGQPYLALEYVEGIPITDYCHSRGLSVEERIGLFLQVCEAVSHAHANLIVYRDLKPSNILVTTAGEVRLLDFGIAKLLDAATTASTESNTEVRAFTLHYAAPEQVRGEPVTTRTDVYSLGVVLYELLANTKPYRLRRQSDAEWEQAILAVEPLKPSNASQRTADGHHDDSLGARRHARRLRGDLDTIALKALAKQPENRYPSAEALSLDLRRHLAGRPIIAGLLAGERQRALQRFDPPFAAGDLLELGAAHRHIAFVASDLHLRPLLHRVPLVVDAHGHRRLLAGVADGLDLLQFVRPGQQVLASFEQLSEEVGAQPVTEHRHAQCIHHFAQLPHLHARQELRFIQQDAVQRPVGVDVLAQQPLEIGITIEAHALGAEANARGDDAATGAVVQLRGEDHHAHAALAVVVRRLQQRGGLAGVHRRIIEIELGHAAILSRRSGWSVRRRPNLLHVSDIHLAFLRRRPQRVLPRLVLHWVPELAGVEAMRRDRRHCAVVPRHHDAFRGADRR